MFSHDNLRSVSETLLLNSIFDRENEDFTVEFAEEIKNCTARGLKVLKLNSFKE